MLLLLHCSWEIMEPVGAHAGKEARELGKSCPTSASEVATGSVHAGQYTRSSGR
jgi:hypothetical protein